MTQKLFLGPLGFAFVAAWIGFNFGYAILCLLGAGVFYAAASFTQGEVDLSDLQDRLRGGSGGAGTPAQPGPRARRVR